MKNDARKKKWFPNKTLSVQRKDNRKSFRISAPKLDALWPMFEDTDERTVMAKKKLDFSEQA